MDGLVILANTPYIRVTEGNPKHSIAFKVRGDNVKEAKVTFIEWNVGKTGVLLQKFILSLQKLMEQQFLVLQVLMLII